VAFVTSFPSPVIRAARLDLREYGPGDAGLVRGLIDSGGEPEALPPGAPADPAEVPEWLADGVLRPRREGAGVHLMMLDRAALRIVGSISLFHADWEVRATEIGYGVRSDERGKGYATEALAAVARWALTEGGIQRAWLNANTDNLASCRVAEKAGFQREGTLRRAGLEDDGLHDLAVFSLLDTDLLPCTWPLSQPTAQHGAIAYVR
jgi:RimJ/RimL family protein N-acetyltransferase